MKKRDFLPFKEARKFARKLKLRSFRKWREYCSLDKKPKNIPSTPNVIYKNKGWISWRNFLGFEFVSFKEVRKFARKLKLRGWREWRKYSESGRRPKYIPSTPQIFYKNKGWISMENFLGYKYIRTKNFLPFTQARKFVRGLNLKNDRDWQEYSKSGKRPKNIPATPAKIYKDKGWKGIRNWLSANPKFISFEEARKYIRKLKINGNDWWKFCKSPDKPSFIPTRPDRFYKDWNGWKDWLGTEGKPYKRRNFLPFIKARKFTRELRLTTSTDWQEYSKSKQRPKNIPSTPDVSYKNKGWISWRNFLGSEFISFMAAKKLARTLNINSIADWRKLSKSNKKSRNIPSNPKNIYKEQWKGWRDFLGKNIEKRKNIKTCLVKQKV